MRSLTWLRLRSAMLLVMAVLVSVMAAASARRLALGRKLAVGGCQFALISLDRKQSEGTSYAGSLILAPPFL
jgi:hypothetical protein